MQFSLFGQDAFSHADDSGAEWDPADYFPALETAETPEGALVVSQIKTPLGTMLAGADAVGICFLEFVDIGQIEAQLERLRRIFEPPFFLSKSPLISRLQAQLDEYFAGERCHFTVPLSMVGTPFQKQVWEALIAIPYGETRSYQAQANALGNPAAIRAVARANGDNRIPILVPCHRVIGKDGKLTGYAGGLWRKEYLLALEGRQINAA